MSCGESGRVDAATLDHTDRGVVLHVTILGAPTDPRVPVVREAIAHWNGELLRLGRLVTLDSGTVRQHTVSETVLRAAGGEAFFGRGPAITRLRATLARVPGDMVIVLSATDLISFSVPWRAHGQGIVAIRRADIRPLSLPNALRNVVAHEMGHALALTHNRDARTLMCGRPASCRPAAFVSDSAYFFPLTAADDDWLRGRWP